MSGVIFAFSTRLVSRRFQNLSLTFAKMSSVYVRCVPTEERIQITLNYLNKSYCLERLKEEEWHTATGRLQKNIENQLNNISKKKKRKKNEEPEGPIEETPFKTVSIKLLKKNGQPLDENVTNIEAWNDKYVTLMIDDEKYEIEINRPTIKSINLPNSILAGFPVFPKIQTEFCNFNDCQFIWYRETKPNAACHNVPTKSSVEVGKGFFYTPSNADIGFRLRVVMIPINGDRKGREISNVSKFEVEAGPGLCPFENRHAYTKIQAAKGSLRVVSYNILADCYADTEFTRTELFPYCPPYALKYDYRKHLVLKEIAGYNSDVICLQEVDSKAFEHDLSPALEALGFKGVFKAKSGISGNIAEGEATFYRESKLRLLEQRDINITQVLQTKELYADIWEKIVELPALKNSIEQRSTVCQLGIYEDLDKPNHILLIANTHLFFHPKATHIRLLQLAVCMRHLQNVLIEYQTQGHKRISFIFCGDFNSSPESAINTFMTTKFIPTDYHLWDSSGEEERLTSLELHHDLNIESGCGYCDYTNFTAGFQEQLDYIFIDANNIKVTQVIPQPDHKDIIAHTALPSIVAPSDHIAQVCDIQWK